MGSLLEDFDERLAHLPLKKRQEIALVVQILLEEFHNKARVKKKEYGKSTIKGVIARIILFGSYARGDFVEDPENGYFSDYDILVVVNNEVFCDFEHWESVEERLKHEWLVTKNIKTPVEYIVQDYSDMKGQLRRGVPFFVDIMRDGITLYQVEKKYQLEVDFPHKMTPDEMLEMAEVYFKRWYEDSVVSLNVAKYCYADSEKEKDHQAKDKFLRKAAFEAHQATEQIYHCLLLTRSLYSPKSHNIKMLRSVAESYAKGIEPAWLYDSKIYRRRFELLRRAYVEARYSPEYVITPEDLTWLFERIEVLQNLVKAFCEQTLKNKEFSPKVR